MGLLVVMVLSILTWGGQAMPAEAHVGSQARLYASDLAVEPTGTPDTWTITVRVVDEDSGRPVRGLDVSAAVAGSHVALADPSNTGRFTGTITAPAGAALVAVDARSGPGGEEALPVQRSWNVVLQGAGVAHSRDEATTQHVAHHRDQGRGTLWLGGVFAGAALIGGLALVTTRRHQLAP